MALTINRKRLPRPLIGCHHSHAVETAGTSIRVSYYDAPFVMGDLWQIRGWLEGLGIGYIEGSLAIILHEGLWEINGEVTVYGAKTRRNLEIVIELIKRSLHGFAGRYPESSYRYSATYSLEWDTPPPEG